MNIRLKYIIFVIQTLFISSIFMDIPILTQFIGFIYLTFIPGIIILGLLRLHDKLAITELILYSIGLSISFLMFIGTLSNFLYPMIGISKPLSTIPLISTIVGTIFILYLIYYFRRDDRSIYFKIRLSPSLLFLLLLPLLTIFGTYMVNYGQNNIILLLLIVILAILVILIGFDKFIQRELYPLTLFVIAISLLYHTSLISSFLNGWDIHTEYYFSKTVVADSIWDSTISNNVNGMLSIVMLSPIYSIILNLDLIWVFKVVNPFIFAFIPLTLYQIFKNYTNDKIAFLSSYFFISFFVFYTEMLALIRQQIAELFLVLLILSMTKDSNKIPISSNIKTFLTVIFGMSLSVSHYGVSYIFMFFIIFSLILLLSIEKYIGRTESYITTTKFVIFYIVFTLTYYIYISNSSIFDHILQIGERIMENINIDLSSGASQGLDIITKETISPLYETTKYLHLLSQFFIIIGGIIAIRKYGFGRDYKILSMMNILLLIFTITIPYFARSFNTSRLYHIALIFLSPFFIIGFIDIFTEIGKKIKIRFFNQNNLIASISIYLAILLLFDTKFVFVIMNDHPTSISLGRKMIDQYGIQNDINNVYSQYSRDEEIFGAKWLSIHKKNELNIYADISHTNRELSSYIAPPQQPIAGLIRSLVLTNKTDIVKNSYIYLGYANLHYGIMFKAPERYGDKKWFYTSDIFHKLNRTNLIYTNGGTIIYLKK